ncbi:MAG TPA: type IV pilus twitching motility protein PilT [Candidatus Hydrogenedentes bacterium]|nr:type IV pilus twitching motility protein PilT [Candidatus Hydrogenedentota bacterium]
MLSFEELFDLVRSQGASDLLISAGAPPVLRINGDLYRTKTDPLTPEDTRSLIYSLLTEDQVKTFEARHELDFSLAYGNKHRFRVNVYRQRGAVAAALRPIPETIPNLFELGMPEWVSEFARARRGLLLVTGPTGSGKTTTLAALIDQINNTRACHIITVEDPIEYLHRHRKSIVDQREIGEDTHSFADALKYVLRQNPDVILIGEMRDLETIQAALTAAETGHFVLATLHTNDAVQSIDRIIDVFPPGQQQQIRFQLSLVLLGIISQRLIPRKDGKGRVLAFEIMRNNNAIANLIRDQKSHQVYSVMETAAREGMVPMDRCLKQLYNDGLISFEDAIAHMRNPKELTG